MAWKACILLTAFAVAALAQFPPSDQPSYDDAPRTTYNFATNNNNGERAQMTDRIRSAIYVEEHYEWEGYDGWYNNPAHPEWGGAGRQLQICSVVVHRPLPIFTSAQFAYICIYSLYVARDSEIVYPDASSIPQPLQLFDLESSG